MKNVIFILALLSSPAFPNPLYPLKKLEDCRKILAASGEFEMSLGGLARGHFDAMNFGLSRPIYLMGKLEKVRTTVWVPERGEAQLLVSFEYRVGGLALDMISVQNLLLEYENGEVYLRSTEPFDVVY